MVRPYGVYGSQTGAGPCAEGSLQSEVGLPFYVASYWIRGQIDRVLAAGSLARHTEFKPVDALGVKSR